MTSLIHIGFPDINEEWLARYTKYGRKIETGNGYYLLIEDPSGAMLYLQYNAEGILQGHNLHFHGKSHFPVAVIKRISRNESALDGALLAWAAPASAEDPESGLFPFAFEVPDYYFNTNTLTHFPCNVAVQLTGFPEKKPFLFESEKLFEEVLGMKAQISPMSVIPSGLFTKNEPYQAKIFLNGIIRETEKLENQFSGVTYFHLLVETAGGTLDLAIAESHIPSAPVPGFIISGDFWLSGKIINL